MELWISAEDIPAETTLMASKFHCAGLGGRRMQRVFSGLCWSNLWSPTAGFDVLVSWESSQNCTPGKELCNI